VIVDAASADLAARVDVVEHRGSELLVRLRLESGDEVRVVAPADRDYRPDTPAGLRMDRERLHWFDRATGLRVDV
jgi:hypothetical protein